jgi:hypothetical protein
MILKELKKNILDCTGHHLPKRDVDHLLVGWHKGTRVGPLICHGAEGWLEMVKLLHQQSGRLKTRGETKRGIWHRI